MKVQKTVELLLKDTTNVSKYMEELQRNNFKGKIEDWDQFINILHDKKLKHESEVVLLNYLSANILDNEYQNSLHNIQDSKIILNLLNIMSFKIKSQTEEVKRLLSIPYGTIYCYLSRKIYKNLQDFNDSHKKIKQRIEEDGKHLTKLLEFCFVDLLGSQSTASSSNQQIIEMIKQFLSQMIKLIKKDPHIFKNQAKFIEHILFNALERKEESQQQLVLLHYDLQNEVATLLSYLPYSVNTVAAYPDRVKYFLNRYINNFYYGFLFSCRGVPTEDILRNYSFEDGFAAQPSFLFDWESLKATTGNNSNEIKVALMSRMKLLQKLICQTISSIKNESVHTWNMLNYLKIIENIISIDAKHLQKQKLASKKGNKDNTHYDVSLLENKLALIKEDYQEASLSFKTYALKILNSLVESSQQGFIKYSEWLYNALYFITVNYESNYMVVKNLIKTSNTILNNCGSIFFEFGEYFIFQSPVNPLDLLQQYYGNYLRQYKQAAHIETSAAVDEMNFRKDKKGKKITGEAISLQQDPKDTDRIVIRETGIILTKQQLENDLICSMDKNQFSRLSYHILQFISLFLQKCGRLQVKPELIAQLDSTFSKIISYPRVVAFSPSQNKEIFLSCLESVLLNNILRYEESQLIGEFDLFFSQYILAEKEESYIAFAQEVKNRIYCLRQSKRLSFIDNSIDLQNYFEKRYQQIQININDDTQTEVFQSDIDLQSKSVLQPGKTTQPSTFSNKNFEVQKTFIEDTQKFLDDNESWGNTETKEISKNNNHTNNNDSDKLKLKRTFTDLINSSSVKSTISDVVQKKVNVDKEYSEFSNQAQIDSSETESQRISEIPSQPIIFGKSQENKNSLFKPSTQTQFSTLFGKSEQNHNSQPSEIINNNQSNGNVQIDDDDDEIILNPILDD